MGLIDCILNKPIHTDDEGVGHPLETLGSMETKNKIKDSITW